MCTFSCKIKFSVRSSRKCNIALKKITDDAVGTADHKINRFFVIFVMSCTHGIFKVIIIIVFSAQHADTALCKEGIRLICLLFGDHQDVCALREVQGTVKACCSRSYDNDVVIFFHFLCPRTGDAGFSFRFGLCFLFCDYTTRHVRCQDTCVYYCKGVRKYAGKGIQTGNVVGQS